MGKDSSLIPGTQAPGECCPVWPWRSLALQRWVLASDPPVWLTEYLQKLAPVTPSKKSCFRWGGVDFRLQVMWIDMIVSRSP